LLHGWEGSANSLYVLSLGQYLFDRGYDVLRLNLRDHGDSHRLNEGIFHSCRITEVVGAVRCIQDRNPDRAVSLVGFSLGGNFSLRVGARAAEAGLDLDRIVAVCPVLDPVHTLARLEEGLGVVPPLLRLEVADLALRGSSSRGPACTTCATCDAWRTLTRMTDHLARVYGGFPSLDAYLRGYAVVGGALASLAGSRPASSPRPTIQSSPASDLGRLASSPALDIVRTARGGHCGFFDGVRSGGWLEREGVRNARVAAPLIRGAAFQAPRRDISARHSRKRAARDAVCGRCKAPLERRCLPVGRSPGGEKRRAPRRRFTELGPVDRESRESRQPPGTGNRCARGHL
jgi:pimeloyl-ACP methyl ester carboxylesterase